MHSLVSDICRYKVFQKQKHCSSQVLIFYFIFIFKEDIILGEMSNLQAFLQSLLIKLKFSVVLLGISISQDSVDFRRIQLHFAPWVCFYTGIVHTLLHVKMHNYTCWSRDFIFELKCAKVTRVLTVQLKTIELCIFNWKHFLYFSKEIISFDFLIFC